MSSPALHLTFPYVAEAVSTQVDRFAPTQPLIWLHFQKKRADAAGMPRLTRLIALTKNAYLFLRYDLIGQPKLSDEKHPIVPLWRVGQFTRAEARLLCKTTKDVIYALPVGVSLDTNVGLNPTQCCPLLEPEKDAEHAELYRYADLRSYVNAEMAAELKFYRELIISETARWREEIANARKPDQIPHD